MTKSSPNITLTELRTRLHAEKALKKYWESRKDAARALSKARECELLELAIIGKGLVLNQQKQESMLRRAAKSCPNKPRCESCTASNCELSE